jgi:CheY-like chemotaxis protein
MYVIFLWFAYFIPCPYIAGHLLLLRIAPAMPKRLLLIDDDEDDAMFFSDALKALRLPIILDYFSNGQTALENLASNKVEVPDVIFLDVNMPVLTGWECLREIKTIARLKTIPIVMYSTANLQQQGIIAGDIGAVALYKKANSFEELKTSLDTLLNSVLRFTDPAV